MMQSIWSIWSIQSNAESISSVFSRRGEGSNPTLTARIFAADSMAYVAIPCGE
jgi:hypothetical protein